MHVCFMSDVIASLCLFTVVTFYDLFMWFRIVHSSLTDLCLSSDATLLPNNQLEDLNNRDQLNVGRFACFLDVSSLHELVNRHILQEKDPSSSICSLSAEENIISSEGGGPELIPEAATSPSPVCKPGKGVKAGQKAPLEAMKSWKKNGFSRF